MSQPLHFKSTAVLFDLDDTLSDHQHSLSTAIEAIQTKLPEFSAFKKENLIATYDIKWPQAYDSYIRGDITCSKYDNLKISSFFAQLGFPAPTQQKIREFKKLYQLAYRASRRATPGSIETLTQLKHAGYRLGIVANGQIGDQQSKAEAIGLTDLVDIIFTSDQVGVVKPYPQIFEVALEALDADPRASFVVGTDPKTDIQGAFH